MQVFPLRDGRLIDRYAFHLENVGGQDRATILEGFCLEYYSAAPAVPPEVIVPPDIEDTEALGGFLSEVRGAAVEVRAPKRGEKRRLAELAAENARVALEHEATAAEQKRARRVEALEQLREALNLESLPARIECFDVSNIQGREIVASMAVFVDGQPKRAHYRTFGMRAVEGQDDFAAIAEAVSRRFARLRDAGDPKRHDESFAARPNLVVIDGGKGQLACGAGGDPRRRRAAAAGGDRAGEAGGGGVRAGSRRADPARAPRPRPAAPAADPRRGAPQGDRASTGSAATCARSSRSSTGSRGSATCAGGRSCSTSAPPSGSCEASQEELEGVPGLPARTARAVYAQLHKAGPG